MGRKPSLSLTDPDLVKQVAVKEGAVFTDRMVNAQNNS